MSEAKVNTGVQEEAAVEGDEVPETSEQAQAEEALEVDEVLDLESELAKARQELDDLRDQMLRGAAENENFKKRVERERQASLKYAGETIFREILPTVDNLERAIAQGVIENADAEKNLAALLEGIELTLKSLIATLEKFEVKSVDSVGLPFDPKVQEAMTMAVSADTPANHVVSEFEKGYYYKDRLLRAAKVIVSSGTE